MKFLANLFINEIRNKERSLRIVMIAIVDYEMGNLRSVQKGFEAVGYDAVITRDPAVIDRGSHVVLPGVGAFGDCVRNLNRFGLVEPLRRSISQGKWSQDGHFWDNNGPSGITIGRNGVKNVR